jgi:hypothetical protein
MKLAYFVHNLNDPAVARRLRMLALGGCTDVVLFGFRRGERPVTSVAGVEAIDLGRTIDGGFPQRIRSILSAALRMGRYRDRLAGVDVLMGRNLEGLLLAAVARRQLSAPARLAYECLDVHRLLLGGRLAGVLRAAERRLLAGVDVLVISSPEYETSYFARHYGALPQVVLIENKVLDTDLPQAVLTARRPMPAMGPPWRIGWYGSLRCRESLHMLSRLSERLGGMVEVVIRGMPSALELPDFDEVVEASAHMRFGGPYDRSRDLPDLYGDVHFAWSIDRFEQGGNGEWALANRLYEGGVFGAVMIAERDVAMGRWLAARGTGVLCEEPVEDWLADFFTTLDAPAYERLAASSRSVPPTNHVADAAECRAVVEALAGGARRTRGAASSTATMRPGSSVLDVMLL